MAEPLLAGLRVLLVEDEYMLASEFAEALQDAGATVLGPAASVVRALAIVAEAGRIDVGVLDVNLGGEAVYPVADALTAGGVPFLFTTGYDAPRIARTYASIPRCEKPFEVADAMQAIHRLLRPEAA